MKEINKQTLDLLRKKNKIIIDNNFDNILELIRKDVNLVNNFNLNEIKESEYEELINELINKGYKLSKDSPELLTTNVDIVLNSIKQDIKTIKYASSNLTKNYEIFKYLLDNNYNFTDDEIFEQPLGNILDSKIIEILIKKLEIFVKDNDLILDAFKEYPDDIDKYIKSISELLSKSINCFPKIKNFYQIFDYVAELDWEEHRKDNLNLYANVFGKICNELKNNSDFDNAKYNLSILDEMEEILDDKFVLLEQAMFNYHTIIHSNDINKLDKIELYRNLISKYSAIYISKSKEKYKKERLERYFKKIKKYYIPKISNSLVYKKTIEYKQKEKFRSLFDKEDKEICDFLNNIVNKYNQELDNDILWNMILHFLKYNRSQIEYFVSPPNGFYKYERYEKACKLINRLNNKYIKYDDQEVLNYKDIIKIDDNGKYYYSGPRFNSQGINKIQHYKKVQYIYKKIKKDIMFQVKKIAVDNRINDYILEDLKSELPFIDEYFEFDKKYYKKFDFMELLNIYLLSDIDAGILYYIEPCSILEENLFSILTNYIMNNNITWLLIFLNDDNFIINDCFDKDGLVSVMDNIKEIVNYAKKYNYRLDNFKNIALLNDLCVNADDHAIAILGEDIIGRLCQDTDYTNDDVKTIIKIAKELVCQMAKRNSSTVPYVSGNNGNYNYSMYDSLDNSILLSGINTNSCFRVDGNDNDFLHYCALDKNGFVLKITDIYGNFIGKASGFRNGNCVFINQLRTIYDEGGLGYEGNYKSEKDEIINTFKKACLDIVNTSQNNKEERNKIDYVFVTKSYALYLTDSNVSDDITDYIGDEPMDLYSMDWKYFVSNTKNLDLSNKNEKFMTDFGGYPLILIASSKKNNNLSTRDIKFKDVPALYKRNRNKIIITRKNDQEITKKINKILAIASYYSNSKFEYYDICNDSVVFSGDNWFIIYNHGEIIKSCVLNFDKDAIHEYMAAKVFLNENNILNNIEKEKKLIK